METEKLCVNLSAAEIGKIDLLVARGLYMNRSDVVRSGLYKVFDEHDEEIDRVRAQVGATTLGVAWVSRATLEQAVADKQMLDYRVIGILGFDSDITPELALEAIHDVFLLGSLRGPKPVLEALASRIRRRPS